MFIRRSVWTASREASRGASSTSSAPRQTPLRATSTSVPRACRRPAGTPTNISSSSPREPATTVLRDGRADDAPFGVTEESSASTDSAARRRLGQNRSGDRMLGMLLRGRRRDEQLMLGDAEGGDLRDRRQAERQRAGLVEHDGVERASASM